MNIRRLLTRASAFLLSVCLFAGVFEMHMPDAIGAEDDTGVSKELLALIERIEAMEDATKKYYGTTDTFDSIARFIRIGSYNDIKWQLLVGAIDPAYEKAMSAYVDLREVHDLYIKRDNNDEQYFVDFPHMMAVADAKKDFSGWAGDVISLAAKIGSMQEAQEIVANDLGVCGTRDLHADLDALNLIEIAKNNGGSLAQALRSYYLQGGVEKTVTTFLLRETGLFGDAITIDAIYDALAVRLDRKGCEEETLVLESMYGVMGTEKLEFSCRAFAEWLYRGYCGESEGHDNFIEAVYPPTCTQRGYTSHVCRKCGKTKKTSIKAIRGHKYNETRIDPTETDPGCEEKLCTTCGYYVVSYFDVLSAGDLDLNGKLDARDYMRLKRGILGTYALTNRQKYLADINTDEVLNAKDYFMFRRLLLLG